VQLNNWRKGEDPVWAGKNVGLKRKVPSKNRLKTWVGDVIEKRALTEKKWRVGNLSLKEKRKKKNGVSSVR